MTVNDGAALHADPQDTKRTIHHLLWEEFDYLTSVLVKQIQTDAYPDVIVGLQRGGLIPAVMLSHHLGTQSFLSLPVRRTTSDRVYAPKHSPVVVAPDLVTQVAGKDLVVVDDIVGSGATLREVLCVLSRYTPTRIRSVAYLVNRDQWNPVNRQEPAAAITYIGKELCGWVVFPWESGHE